MTMFGIELTNERAATLRFEKFPEFAHDRLLGALQNIEQRLKAAVLAAEPGKTGSLKAQTGGRVYDHGNRIAAVVGVRAPNANDARKAAALEYGSRGVAITMHHRLSRISALSQRAGSDPLTMEWRRTPTITAQRFLRGPMDAIRGGALAELQAALDAAVQDAER